MEAARSLDTSISPIYSVQEVALYLPKKYSTNVRLTVPAFISPNAMMGAATSPRLKASVVDVNL